MFRYFERFVALRYLRSKRKEVFISIITIISVLGVAVSVMVLNIVLSVMTGFEVELKAKLLNTTAHIVVNGRNGSLQNWETLAAELSKLNGVEDVMPYTYQQAMLSTGKSAHGMIIKGVPDNVEAALKVGSLLRDSNGFKRLFSLQKIEVERPGGTFDEVLLPSIVIGEALSSRLGILVGDTVNIFAPTLSSSPQGLIPRSKRFVVVDIYSSGLQEYESTLAYTSIAAAQQFFGFGNGVSGLEISVENLMKAPELAREINELIGHPLAPYYATDWTVPNKPLWDAIELEQRVYFIVLLLLILIASFSIVSTLVMVVMEKSKDIAVLKTIGTSDRSILRIFLLQGIIIGLVGTLLGTFLGYIGAIGLKHFGFPIDPRVFSLTEVPVNIVPSNFFLVAVSALLITSLAGIYPALRAARLDPANALRFE